ncbi:type I restriction-modification system endonuclease, partial [Siphonobacter sp. BAB-5405]|uniref:DEAD/DEAH box helicase family protein n=1 Tax=Siphonobacter sp. BAB-5405 TaxID=1864825 RepID=UPI000CBDF7D2
MLSNFSFLAPEFSILANIGESAEFLLFTDPASSLSKLRLFGEKLTELLFEKHSLAFPYENNFHYRLLTLKDENILPATVKDILFLIKKVGNRAVHDGSALERDAKDGLRSMFNVARWFFETYAKEEKDLSSLFYQEPTYVDTRLALQKLEEDYRKLEKRLNDLLAERDTEGLSSSAQQVIQQRSERAARKVEMSEAQTRELIDLMLREAGWEVDTETINFKKNRTLPETGKNKAIAEWPAGPLWADYALFIGTELYGFVEAKRYNQDISTDLRQSKVYAERVKAEHGATLLGQWGAYQVPFLFSTNGRPYLKQIETKSGIWFLDARQPTNHAKALQGWYSPQGLINLRERDIQRANEKLQQTPLDFLESKTGLGLRKYQIDAIRAVENHIIQSPHHRKALVAMATGTGKTRTIIGLCYHLIQTNRFSRILFLVDRTLLGTQASEAFKDNKVADLNTFADIYEVKGIKHVLPGPDTRLHFATVQGMVKRLFYNESEGTLPSV